MNSRSIVVGLEASSDCIKRPIPSAPALRVDSLSCPTPPSTLREEASMLALCGDAKPRRSKRFLVGSVQRALE